MSKQPELIETFEGHPITYQGISYACYPLGIVGHTSVQKVRNAIKRKLKARTK